MNFANKILNLIEKDKLNEAIIELSILGNKNKIVDELIIQAARLNEVDSQIRIGTISYENSRIEKNKIRKALVDTIHLIEKKKNSSIKESVDLVINRSEEDEVISITEIILKSSNEILQENQRILTSYFHKMKYTNRIKSEIVTLYHEQKRRGDFGIWTSFLRNKIKSRNINNRLKKDCKTLLKIIKNLHSTLYSYTRNKPNQLIYYKNLNWFFWWPRHIYKSQMAQLQINSPEEIEHKIHSYLNYLRDLVENIGMVLSNMKSNKP